MKILLFQIRLLGLGLLLAVPARLFAAEIIATDGYEPAVKAAIALAQPGDTVKIPAGTWAWTNGQVSYSGITLAGMGTNVTILVDRLPASGNFAGFFNIIPSTNSFTRLTAMTFADDGRGIMSYKGKVLVDGRAYYAAAPWRIDHCSFLNLNGNNVFPYGNNGLIDHCVFFLRAEAVSHYGLSINPGNPWNVDDPMNDPWGDFSYSRAHQPKYGSTNALYIESCYFTNQLGQGAPAVCDAYAGSVSVFRNNYVVNCGWYNHGNDTSGRYRSCRHYELYNNTFIDNQSWVTAMDFRGGTGVIFSNTVSGYKMFNTMENYRNVQPNSPFGGVDGANQWDSFDPVPRAIGTNTVAGTKVVCPGANWTPHQWAGYTVSAPTAGSVAIGHGAGSVTFCLIQDNTADTLSMIQPKDFQIVFNVGDVFKIYSVNACLDQVGRGSGDLIHDVRTGNYPNWVDNTWNTRTMSPTWPNQDLDPLYSWGNTLNGSPSGVTSPYPNLKEGRDVYFNTAKPDYLPLTFPHPIVALQDGTNNIGGTGGTGGGVTNPPSGLPPVSGLRYFIR
jgi:hypothetical protein